MLVVKDLLSKRLLLIAGMGCVCLLLGSYAMAQSEEEAVSNRRSNRYVNISDTLKLDSLPLIPGSLILEAVGQYIPPADYTVDEANSTVIFSKRPQADSILANYRVFPYDLTKTYYHKDPRAIDTSVGLAVDPFIYMPFETQAGLFDFGKLNYDGSFSRGISFGNNQNVVVNSDFNLQLSGMLTDDIELVAAMTDNNIPIQPEGNTQQIQEFDKIFIQLSQDQHRLTMGDFQIDRPQSYFLNYLRKVKGGQLSTALTPTAKGKLEMGGSAAIARGNYQRMSFMGKEGNQGPYKLIGANGETFIIVMAGSERVYIDGQRLERGADYDYIIDYNTAELTFTPNRMITKDRRIVVEFEYSNQNYTRSLIESRTNYEQGKMKVRFNMFSEQDHKNAPVQSTTPEQRNTISEVLSGVGDSLKLATLPGERVIQNIEERTGVMYEKRDSIVDGVTYSIFVFSIDSDSAIYQVSFSKLGTGSGNYIIAPEQQQNGRVYQWVAPVDGKMQGAYEPVLTLASPLQRQMFTLGADYQFNKTDILTAEVALSNKDVNTFSKLHSEDDIGTAAHLAYHDRVPLSDGGDAPKVNLDLDAQYEYRNKHFNHIETYRPQEFKRDWNLNQRNVAGFDQHIGMAGIGLSKTRVGLIQYNFTNFLMEQKQYTGYRHGWKGVLNKHGFVVDVHGSYLTSEDTMNQAQFFRPRADVSKSFKVLKGWRIGSYFEQEANQIQSKRADTLDQSSFRYDLIKFYIDAPDTAVNPIGGYYSERRDHGPRSQVLKLSSTARTAALNGGLFTNRNQQVKWNVTYRNLKINDSTLTTATAEQSVLSRIEYNLTLGKGFVRSSTFYEIGTGQEQKREFEYLPVQAGVGTHEWIDYNEDGDQQLNEFEVANYQDRATYVKVFKPTDEFQKIRLLQLNQNLSLQPRALWNSKNGIQGALSRFSTQSYWQINRKVFDFASVSRFNPFVLEVEDTALVTLNSSLRNILYFNRSNSSNFGIDLNWLDNRTKAFLTSGFESRTRQEYGGRIWVNMSRSLTTEVKYNTGFKAKDVFSRPQYNVDFQEVQPKLTYIRKSQFRVTLQYDFLQSGNAVFLSSDSTITGGEGAISHKMSMDFRYNVVAKSTISGSFSYAMVQYDFPQNTPVAFVILQGLEKGNNFLWNLTMEKKLTGNLQLSLMYDGRKIGENKTIHVGSAQVRALF